MAGGHFGIAGEGIDMRLRPGFDRARHRVHTVVKVDPGIGILVGKHIAEAATTVRLWTFLLPPFESDRQGRHAVGERAPGGGLGGTGLVQRLRIVGDFGQLEFPGLFVQCLDAAPEDPLWPLGEGVGHTGEIVRRRAGVAQQALGHAPPPCCCSRASMRAEACARSVGGSPRYPKAPR